MIGHPVRACTVSTVDIPDDSAPFPVGDKMQTSVTSVSCVMVRGHKLLFNKLNHQKDSMKAPEMRFPQYNTSTSGPHTTLTVAYHS